MLGNNGSFFCDRGVPPASSSGFALATVVSSTIGWHSTQAGETPAVPGKKLSDWGVPPASSSGFALAAVVSSTIGWHSTQAGETPAVPGKKLSEFWICQPRINADNKDHE